MSLNRLLRKIALTTWRSHQRNLPSAEISKANTMTKFNFKSWLGGHTPRPSQDNADQKKQQRRSASTWSSLSPLNSKNQHVNGTSAEDVDHDRHSKAASSYLPTSETPATEMGILAQKILMETQKLEAYMTENGLPIPGFDVNSPADFPKLPEEVRESRREIIYATKQLRDLAIGPREKIRWGVWEFLDVLALQLINHYGIAQLFPTSSTITLPELESKTTLDPVNLARILRLAMTNKIFHEPSPGVIAHTASSRLLAEDADLQAWVGFNVEDIFPSSGRVLDALRRFPEATDLSRTGFNLMAGTVDAEPMFVTFGREPARARRMGRAMASLTGGEGYEVDHLLDVARGGYDFSEVDARGGTFVDIGGSHGFVCVEVARMYRRMKFVVQDLPRTVESAPSPICEDEQVAGRIEFLAHDFFQEQVVKGADVYFFRWIMHNYSTPYAVKILQSLVPALKPGARVLVNDHCLREPGQENPWDEQVVRRMDMVMLVLLNAQERTEEEYRALFRSADEGFVFKGVTRPRDGRMSIIEAVWRPGRDKEDVEVGVEEMSAHHEDEKTSVSGK